MKIKSVSLKGFRNFKDAKIFLTEKSLIIGCNDIGKTNLLYALRILLDRTLSDADIEPRETDFYAYEPTNDFMVLVEFESIYEECVIAKMREHISDDGKLILAYHAVRNSASNSITYKLLVGKDEESLTEIDSRYYLRTLNIKFIGSKRDLFSFIHNERKRLLQDTKELRNDDEIESDNQTLVEIEDNLNEVGSKVSSLSYIKKSTDGINSQLGELSYHNENQEVIFDVGSSAPSEYVERLQLASRVEGKTVLIGGDGRNNQIHLALWSARNKIQQDENNEPLEINVFCIEEPEAHLHPHQQRKLVQYLINTLEGQVIITTHSPQIACEVPPSSIIRLFSQDNGSLAAGNGVNPFTENAFIEFGHRLNIISAETFFADVVFLVEGVSEELFYKALSVQIGIDLDRFNISILMVDGIGFKPYASLLSSLRIPFVIRTDNDVFKIPGQDKYRLAGIQRAIDIYKAFFTKTDVLEELLKPEDALSGFKKSKPPQEIIDLAINIARSLEKIGIFIADVDLESDLHAVMPEVTSGYFGIDQNEDTIIKMQKRKATFMFDFLHFHDGKLSHLKKASITKPLEYCQKIAEEIYGTPANN